MKKFKKLIPAFCMLLVSAVMLGSSTFAWFSMNNKVTATGLDVTAKSNTQFLVISDSNTTLAADYNTTTIGAAYQARANLPVGFNEGTADEKKVLPVSINKTGAELKLWDKKQDEQVKIAADAWYTAQSTVYDGTGANGTSKDDTTLVNVKTVSGNDLEQYRLTYKVYLSLAKGSDDMTGTVKITSTFTGADASVSLRVVVKDKNYDFSNAIGGTKENTTESVTIKAGEFVEVTIYAYIDGTSSTVNSAATLTALKGSASLVFEVA
mgnify:CR=1 FL=1